MLGWITRAIMQKTEEKMIFDLSRRLEYRTEVAGHDIKAVKKPDKNTARPLENGRM